MSDSRSLSSNTAELLEDYRQASIWNSQQEFEWFGSTRIDQETASSRKQLADAESAIQAFVVALQSENERLRKDCLLLAQLAADFPAFDNPLNVWTAQGLRDGILNEAGIRRLSVSNSDEGQASK